MADNKQKGLFSDAERDLVKSAFKDNDELLKTILKVFLQMPLNTVEQAILTPLKGHTQVLGILRRQLLPTLDNTMAGEIPIGQALDLWMTIDIKEKSPEEGVNFVKARELLIKYLDQQLGVLEGKSEGKMKLAECIDFKSKDPAEVYINLLMRNTLIYHVQSMLSNLKIMAEMKEETLEQAKERMKKDSMK